MHVGKRWALVTKHPLLTIFIAFDGFPFFSLDVFVFRNWGGRYRAARLPPRVEPLEVSSVIR